MYSDSGDKPVLIAVVIPCYRVVAHIEAVIGAIGPEVGKIYCVDDCCPDHSGEHIRRTVSDPRVIVLQNESNLGVGGATMAGYVKAVQDGADIIVKIDGDGQMDPRLIMRFVRPIMEGRADYTKGNRYFYIESLKKMPTVRLLGNTILSFISKVSTGYWDIFDPVNGYTAIHRKVIEVLPLDKISQRYFFESDILFRLNTHDAVVEDIPMDAVYEDEVSQLRPGKVIPEFIFKHTLNIFKRIGYQYFLRDFNIASIELLVGFSLLVFGLVFGTTHWLESTRSGIPVSAGTVMLAALPVLMGVQLLLSFLSYDTRRVPRAALHKRR